MNNNIQFANTRKFLKSKPRKFEISGNSKQFVRTLDSSKHTKRRKTIYLAKVTSNNNSERKQKVKALYCKSRSLSSLAAPQTRRPPTFQYTFWII